MPVLTSISRFAALVALMAALPVAAQLRGIDMDTNWYVDTAAAHPGDTVTAALEVHLEKGYHVNANKPLEDYLIPTVMTVKAETPLTVIGIAYPEPLNLKTQFSEIPLAVLEERFVLGAQVRIAPDAMPGEYTVPVKLRYQACNATSCLAPKTLTTAFTIKVVDAAVSIERSDNAVFQELTFGTDPDATTSITDTTPDQPAATVTGSQVDDAIALLDNFDVLATTGGYLNTADFIDFIDRAETGRVEQGFFEGKGPIAIIVLVMLGGIALNLTPCVLPLIPINLAIIGAGAQAGTRTRGFLLGGTYGLAMATVYGVLGLIVILTAGTFGAINSTLWFNAGIAILFVVLGLAMFDIITIDFSRFQTKLNVAGKAKKGSFLLAFGMGAIAALLAGACVAPVVIQVIVYSGDLYAKGQTLALALPFFLGIGMALPWPFAGAGLSFLPKPGAWMVRVKQVMGLFILGFAAYYAYLGWEIFDSRRVDPDSVAGAVEEQIEEGWVASVPEGLRQAMDEDKLVLVDMWATWCKNCLVMGKTTFKDEAVLARMDGYVKIKFQAEDLDTSPAKEFIERFNGIGLPTYAILRPKDAKAPQPSVD